MSACITPLLTPMEHVLVGVSIGLLFGVPLGRWSLLLLIRWSHRQQRRKRGERGRVGEVPRVYPHTQVEHAGYYVQQLRAEGRRAGWSQLEPPGSFARVRS